MNSGTNKINNLIKRASTSVGLDLPYFISGGFWLIFSSVVVTLGGIFLSSLFARMWPKDVYGQYTFLTAALSFLSLISLPGMGQAIVQAVSEKKEGTYKFATWLIFKYSFIGSIILILGSIYFYFRENPNLALAVFFAALVFPINSSFNLFSSYLNGKKNFKKNSIITSCSQLFTISLTALALWKFSSLVLVAFAATWSSAAISTVFTYTIFKNVENNKIDFKLIKLGKVLSLGNAMALGVDYFDRFAIPIFIGFSQNAVYAIAILIPMQLQNFLKVSMNLAQPKIAEISVKNAKKILLLKSFQLEIPIAVITLLYIIAAPYIFRILYPEYQSSVFISQIFALILLFYPSNLFGIYLVKKRAIKKGLLSSIIFSIVSIVSLLIFLWAWGLIGAVFSKIFAKVIQTATTQIFFNSELAEAEIDK